MFFSSLFDNKLHFVKLQVKIESALVNPDIQETSKIIRSFTWSHSFIWSRREILAMCSFACILSG
jgi:hypothetical protein